MKGLHVGGGRVNGVLGVFRGRETRPGQGSRCGAALPGAQREMKVFQGRFNEACLVRRGRSGSAGLSLGCFLGLGSFLTAELDFKKVLME